MKKQIITIASFFLTLTPLTAIAQISFQGEAVYRTTSPNAVYFYGLPGTSLSASLGLTEKTKSVKVDSCGVASLKDIPNFIGESSIESMTVNGISQNPYSGMTALPYKCNAGVKSFSDGYNAGTEPETTTWIDSGYIRIKGLTPGSVANIVYTIPAKKNVKINACGFGVVKESAKLTLSDNWIVVNNESMYYFDSLPTAPNPPYCKKVGTEYKGYVPQEWVF